MKSIPLITLAWGATNAILALGQVAESTNPEEVFESYFHASVGKPFVNSTLPDSVVAKDGEVTLVAEFSEPASTPVMLYLVNRTEHRLAFSSQDSDVFVKLETQSVDRGWERAQTHHGSSCGNSYHLTPSLRPGEHFRFLGFTPKVGELQTVRYRMFQQHAVILDENADERVNPLMERDLPKLPLELVSNVGIGKVRAKDLETSRRDGFAINMSNFHVVRDLAVGAVEGAKPDIREAAVSALGRFATEETHALVRELLADPNPSIQNAAMKSLAVLGLTLDSAEKEYQQFLNGEDVAFRRYATWTLSERTATHEITQFAKQQLFHDDLVVRTFAMSVIAKQCKEDPQAKAFINSIYDDPDPKIQSVFETTLFPRCINYQERGYKGRFQRQNANPIPNEIHD